MVDTETRQIIGRFVDTLARKGIQIEQVILYGSYALGRVHSGSDLDLAIVSPDFGKDRFEEGKLLLQTAWVLTLMQSGKLPKSIFRCS